MSLQIFATLPYFDFNSCCRSVVETGPVAKGVWTSSWAWVLMEGLRTRWGNQLNGNVYVDAIAKANLLLTPLAGEIS